MNITGRRLVRVSLALALGLLIGALLCEVGARVVLRMRGRPYDAAAVEARLSALAAGMRSFVPRDEIGDRLAAQGPLPDLAVLQHPYAGYDVYKGYREFQQDQKYFTRAASGNAPDPARVYEVLLLGGSVAAQFGDNKSGARVLSERLRALPEFADRPVRVLTYARMGYRQPQSSTQLAFLLASGFAPDAVVLLDGFNDVALSCNNAHNGVFPLFPSTSHWGFLLRSPLSNEAAMPLMLSFAEQSARCEQLASGALEAGWSASALLGNWSLQRALSARTRAHEAQQQLERLSKSGTRSAAETGLGFDGDAAAAVDLAVSCWRESSRSIRALCDARGIVYVHALQPALHDEQAGKPLSADERAGAAIDEYWLEGVKLGYPRLREAVAILKQQGERIVDLSAVFRGVEESMYTDYCHLNERGNERIAQALFAALADAPGPLARPR